MRTHYYHINIRPVARGFYVDVGCQSLIYRDTPEDVEEMIMDLAEYMRDPKAKREWYYNTFDDCAGEPVHAAQREVGPSR